MEGRQESIQVKSTAPIVPFFENSEEKRRYITADTNIFAGVNLKIILQN